MAVVEEAQYPVLAESDKKDGEYIHRPCGTTLLGKNVYHPIWYKEFTAAGGGEVSLETVPYCPKCESEPSSAGKPIVI